MELIDVIDVNRNKLGYTKERHEKLEDYEYNAGVELWNFYNHKLLLTQRALNKSHPGMWEVPGGGVLAGESSDDTVKREILEEIGYTLDNNYELIGTSLHPKKNHYVDVYKSNINIELDKCHLQDDEVSDIKYVTKEEFLLLNSENKIVKTVFNRYLEHQKELDKDW